jgi:TPR repeat protein
MRKRIQAALCCALLLSAPAFAVDPQAAAKEAFDRGDYAAAAEALKPLAAQGDVAAQYNLAVLYAEGKGVAKNAAAAAQLFGKAARQGNALAQYDLGLIYRDGMGVEPDPARGWLWLSIASANLHGGEAAQAAKQRDDLERKMTPDALQDGRDMLESCQQVSIKYCD